jgi:hypothetical protein
MPGVLLVTNRAVDFLRVFHDSFSLFLVPFHPSRDRQEAEIKTRLRLLTHAARMKRY